MRAEGLVTATGWASVRPPACAPRHPERDQYTLWASARREARTINYHCLSYLFLAGSDSQAPAQTAQQPIIDAPSMLPLFSPGLGAAHGLDMLAAAAANKSQAQTTDAPTMPLLAKPGPFNPAASLAPKVVKRILDLDFVEM